MLRFIVLGLAACLAAPGLTPAADEPKPNAETKDVVQSNTQFALQLYARLAKEQGNLFFSPYSISTALAMTYAGARGETAEQMAKTLRFTLGPDQLHPAFAALVREVRGSNKERPFQLNVANALWGQKGYPFLPAFLELTKSDYAAGLREVDFAAATEQARLQINRWVEEQTQDKIKDLIQPGVLTPMSRLVLTNAIYFKAPWGTPFGEKATKPEDFFVKPDQKVQVPMMHKIEFARYLDGGKFQLLELDYKGGTQSMVICLPRKDVDISDVEGNLVPRDFNALVSKAKSQRMNMAIPKFKITREFEMNKVLEAMGMPAAFSIRDADFSGIDGRKDLYLSNVVHKAFVDVNEYGTEAAAATAAVIGVKSAPPSGEPIEFRADHPFLFVIRDRKTGSILFMGRLSNPQS